MVLDLMRAGALLLLGCYAGGLLIFILAPGIAALPGDAFTLYWQACNHDYGTRAPIVVLTCSFFLAATCALMIGQDWAILAPALFALVLLVGSIIITLTRMEPLNRIANTWNPGALPSDWACARDRWLSWQRIRTAVTVVSFVSLLASLIPTQ
jgi:hypothetical protein